MGEPEFVGRRAGEDDGPRIALRKHHTTYNAQSGTPGALTPESSHDKIKAASGTHGGDDWNDL